MKKTPDVSDNEGGYLNVCYLQSTIAVRRGGPVVYYMTLLAHAAVMRQKEMVKMLTTIDKGAGKNMNHTDTSYNRQLQIPSLRTLHALLIARCV